MHSLSKTFVLAIMLAAAATAGVAQTKHAPKKKIPVVGTVTIKGGMGPGEPVVVRNVTDPDIWKTVPLLKHRATLDFPTKDLEAFDDGDAYFDGVWNYSAETRQATFRLFVREVEGVIEDADIAERFDSSIEQVFREPSNQLKSVREIRYSGRPGREVIYETELNMQAVRLHILNEKLFALFVIVGRKSDWPAMQKWADKFFESLRVEFPANDAASF